ncbi:aromatic compound dioxygenase [Ceratobasidium sp. AG-I]|nr:aromatic compound dioxygenase [Ceratobasidium sp. AG-I]
MLAKRDKELYTRNSRHFGAPSFGKQGPGGPWGHNGSHSTGSFSPPATITGIATATSVVATAVSSTIASSTATANTPTYSTIQNSTCVTTPESEEGPYYVNNEFLRTNVADNQPGVEMLLDIGVMDVSTCQPLEQALVEIWHCNATGLYSGFTTSAGIGGPGGNGTMNITMSATGSFSDTVAGTDSTSALPTGAPGGGGDIGGSTNMTDQLTFLRGGYPTNSEGMVEFQSVYPGYYDGRAVHVHIMVHTNYSVSSNGTIISHAGQVRHIGRLFFEDSLNDQIVEQGVYANNNHSRTYNTDDPVFDVQNANGYNAYAQTELLGDSVLDGILGYITVGVDPTTSTSISSTNYQTSPVEDLSA